MSKSTLHMHTIRGIGPAEVRDAKRDLVITVKEGDVSSAKKKAQNACAMANAICRQERGEITEARVHKTVTLIKHKSGKWERYRTPIALYLQLHMFDKTGQFEVGDYRLRKPEGMFTLENITKKAAGRKKPSGHNAKTKRRIFRVTGMRPDAHPQHADLD